MGEATATENVPQEANEALAASLIGVACPRTLLLKSWSGDQQNPQYQELVRKAESQALP